MTYLPMYSIQVRTIEYGWITVQTAYEKKRAIDIFNLWCDDLELGIPSTGGVLSVKLRKLIGDQMWATLREKGSKESKVVIYKGGR